MNQLLAISCNSQINSILISKFKQRLFSKKNLTKFYKNNYPTDECFLIGFVKLLYSKFGNNKEFK
jgi:hypothetical protein